MARKARENRRCAGTSCRPLMALIYKTAVTPPRSQVVDSEAEEAFAALSVDQQTMIDATSLAMAALASEEREQREKEV